MHRIASVIPIALFVALGAVPARAQQGSFSVNPYIGYYAFDESSFKDAFDNADVSSDPIIGLRVGIGDREGFSIDLGYGHSSVDGELTFEDLTLPEESSINIYYAALNYELPIPTISLFVSGGAGAVRYEPAARDSRTDLLVNYGAGVSIPFGNLKIRADAKDHIDLCEGPGRDNIEDFDFGACVEDASLHNIELSVGVEFSM